SPLARPQPLAGKFAQGGGVRKPSDLGILFRAGGGDLRGTAEGEGVRELRIMNYELRITRELLASKGTPFPKEFQDEQRIYTSIVYLGFTCAQFLILNSKFL